MGRAFSTDGRTITGGPVDGTHWITQDFRAVQYQADGTPYLHMGLDAVIPEGTDVLMPHPGAVKFTTDEAQGTDYGNSVWVDFDGGGSMAVFHLQSRAVSVGDVLYEGQLLGVSGHTGFVRPPGPAGAHAHFQCALTPTEGLTNWNNVIDPIAFFTMLAARQPAPPPTLGVKEYLEQIAGYADQGIPSPVLASQIRAAEAMLP